MRHSCPSFSTTGTHGLGHCTTTLQPDGMFAHPIPIRCAVVSVIASDGSAHQNFTVTPDAYCQPRLVTRAKTWLGCPTTGRLIPPVPSTQTSGDSQNTVPPARD